MSALPSMSERDWQNLVVNAAQLNGWRTYHTHDSRRSAAGFPDLTLVRDDTIIFAELKSDTGRVTPEQRAWLEDLARVLVLKARLWRPEDEAEVFDTLARPRH